MKKLIVLLMLLIVVAGCGPTGPQEGTDWCFRYDYRLDDNGVNLINGAWEQGLGLVTDGGGLLVFNYMHDKFVEPVYVVVVVQRPGGIFGDITVVASGEVFGASAAFSATMPTTISTYPLVFQPDTVGLAGTSINISAQSSQQMILQSIEVRGNGSNPFGVNMCGDSIPLTPATDTITPEFTYTPTITATGTLTRTPSPTPSITFTPSPTPAPWQCVITGDFAGWNFPPYGGATSTVSGGQIIGAASGDTLATFLSAEIIITGTVTSFAIDYSYERPEPPPALQEIRLYINGDISATDSMLLAAGAGTLDWTGSIGGTNTFYVLGGVYDSGAGYDLRASELFITGYGTQPFSDGPGVECDSLTEPTPTPSITPTVGITLPSSLTPPGGWTCTFDFANNNQGWISVYNALWGLSVDDVGAWRARNVPTANILGIRYNAPGTMPLTSVRVKGRTYGVRSDDPDELNFRTYDSAWSAYVEQSFNNQAFDSTYTFTSTRPTTRFEAYLSVTQKNVDAVEIYLIEFKGVGGTNPCAAGTATATMAVTLTPAGTGTGTLTPRPLVTGTPLLATRTPFVMPTLNIQATYVTVTGTPPTSEAGTPSTALPPDASIGYEAGEMLGFTWQIGWGVGRTVFAWIGQVTGDITAFMNAFLTAQPEAIPGLPQCMTHPMDHDICAIYYILDFTLLAEGTPGALIVPLILLIMNFYIFMKFVSWVLRLIRRGENTTSVS